MTCAKSRACFYNGVLRGVPERGGRVNGTQAPRVDAARAQPRPWYSGRCEGLRRAHSVATDCL